MNADQSDGDMDGRVEAFDHWRKVRRAKQRIPFRLSDETIQEVVERIGQDAENQAHDIAVFEYQIAETMRENLNLNQRIAIMDDRIATLQAQVRMALQRAEHLARGLAADA
jgi:septal ring factor EnvC (AmiA/AmiB activator)